MKTMVIFATLALAAPVTAQELQFDIGNPPAGLMCLAGEPALYLDQIAKDY